jgi:peptide/nickel transport system permease protein
VNPNRTLNVNENIEMYRTEKPPTMTRLIWREIKVDPFALVSLFLIIAILVITIGYGSYIGTDAALEQDLWNRYKPPSWAEGGNPESGHLLGTDQGGRDMFKILLVSARNSIGLGWAVGIIAVIVGTIVGLTAGYNGGHVDNIIMRLCDTWMLVPTFMTQVVLLTIMDRTIINFILVLTLFGWIGAARTARGLSLQQRNMDYVAASKTLGTRNIVIVFKKVLPNMVSILAANIVLVMSGIIGIEVGLTMLGYGLGARTPSFGYLMMNMLNLNYLQNRWWMWAPAITLLLVIMLSINFVGQAVQRAVDPRQRLV